MLDKREHTARTDTLIATADPIFVRCEWGELKARKFEVIGL